MIIATTNTATDKAMWISAIDFIWLSKPTSNVSVIIFTCLLIAKEKIV